MLEIESDEVRLNQIILNLVSNAVKFTMRGSIKITCKFIDDKKEVLITVEDTGSGIKEEDRDLVFQEIEGREINLHYDKNKMGSGYGLKISYNIAKRLTHNLSFTSEVGIGTTFSLSMNPIESSIYKMKYNAAKNNFAQRFNVPRKVSSFKDIKKFSLSNIQKNQENFKIQNLSESDLNEFLSDRKSSLNDTIIHKPNFKIEEGNQYRFLNQIDEDAEYDDEIEFIRKFTNKSQTKTEKKSNNFPVLKIEHLPSYSFIKQNLNQSQFYKYILLVDDNLNFLNSLETNLKNFLQKKKLNKEYGILLGTDGKDIIKFLLDSNYEKKIEYIITDENMEFANGSFAIKTLNEMKKRGIYEGKSEFILSSSDDDFPYKSFGFDYAIKNL